MSGLSFKKRGGFERGQGFTASRGVPDEAIATVLMDALHDGLHSVRT